MRRQYWGATRLRTLTIELRILCRGRRPAVVRVGTLLGAVMATLLAFQLPVRAAPSSPAQAWGLAAERGDEAALAHLYAGIEAHDTAAETAYASYCLSRDRFGCALRWFSAAAQKGDATAQEQLAELLARGGPTLKPDAAQAVFWYRKAAAQGNAAAERSLGLSYLNGDGVASDPLAARHWLQLAAAGGDAAAMQALAGLGVAPAAAASLSASPSPSHVASHPAALGAATAHASAAPVPSAPGARGRGTPTASAVAAVPAQAEQGPAAVLAAVRAWASAWSSKDFTGYFGAYLPDYAPPGMNHATWQNDRHARIADKASITVSLDQLRTRIQGNTATATFIEHFRAGALRFVGAKTLRLQLVDGRWLIAAES